MTPGARASAAIEVLADIEKGKRPASEALKDWGLSHRFAGSGDRAAIGNLVFDALRKRASSAYTMGDTSPRALVLRTLVTGWGKTPNEVAALADGGNHAPEPLSESERAGLERDMPRRCPAGNSRRLSGVASGAIRASLWRSGRRGGGGTRGAGVGRSQGKRAESDAREGAEGASAFRCGAD